MADLTASTTWTAGAPGVSTLATPAAGLAMHIEEKKGDMAKAVSGPETLFKRLQVQYEDYAMRGLALMSCASAAHVGGMGLTKADWDAKTAGKTVFLEFIAPWCWHCNSMKPDWDKLMNEVAVKVVFA